MKQHRHLVLGNNILLHGVEKLIASKRELQTSPKRGVSSSTLTPLFLRELGQTPLLRVLRLGLAVWGRQIITNTKVLSCHFGFPVIVLLRVFETEARKPSPDPVLIIDKYRDPSEQTFYLCTHILSGKSLSIHSDHIPFTGSYGQFLCFWHKYFASLHEMTFC